MFVPLVAWAACSQTKTPDGLTIVGNVVADRSGAWMTGEAIKIRVPGRGEYYVAVRPPAGFPFQASGWVDHDVIEARAEGRTDSVDINSQTQPTPITGRDWPDKPTIMEQTHTPRDWPPC